MVDMDEVYKLEKAFAKDEDQLYQDFANGVIDRYEYLKQLNELESDYREELRELRNRD